MKEFIILIRPWQWTKNLFVYLPIFFGGQFFNLNKLCEATIVFFSFCLISSAVYCFNDICDIQKDKNHPVKKHRPIASGHIGIRQAFVLMSILTICSFLSTMFLREINHFNIWLILAIYMSLNILYSIKLKKYAIIDIFIISIGFELRVLGGGIACDVVLSQWIVLMVFLLTLFLGFAKRRDDLILATNGIELRDVLKGYNLIFINLVLAITASVTLVCYILYTVSPDVTFRYGSKLIYLSSIFVLAGILRYLQIAIVNQDSGLPSVVLIKDKFIIGCIIGWLLFFTVVIYF